MISQILHAFINYEESAKVLLFFNRTSLLLSMLLEYARLQAGLTTGLNCFTPTTLANTHQEP